MEIKANSERILDLANKMKSMRNHIGDNTAYVTKDTKNLISNIRSRYHEYNVRSVVNEIEDTLRTLNQLSQQIDTRLERKEKALSWTSGKYKETERESKANFKKNLQIQYIKGFLQNLFGTVKNALHALFGSATLNKLISNKELEINNQKENKTNTIEKDRIPGYEEAYNRIAELEKIRQKLGEKGTISIWELNEEDRAVIYNLIGMKPYDEINNPVDLLEIYRIKQDIPTNKEGLHILDEEFFNKTIDNIYQQIQKSEDKNKELEALRAEMTKDYAGYLEKAKEGYYYEAYLKSVRENQGLLSGMIFGRDPVESYNADICGNYMILSRYVENAPIQIKEAGFKDSRLYNMEASEMTFEEYINTMGPIWELEQKYRTYKDELRDAQIAITILSVFTGTMSLSAGGAAAAGGIDAATDIADTAISKAMGDDVGATVGIISLLLPELLEGIGKTARTANHIEQTTDAAGAGIKGIDNVDDELLETTTKRLKGADGEVVEGASKAYTGGRTQVELDDLARDPSHAGRIEPQGIKEREIGLDLERQGKLGRIKRDPQVSGGSEFIDETTGLKWDIKSFESYPIGGDGKPITNPRKGAFTVDNAMKKINKEFGNGHNVVVDVRGLVPEHIKQLREAIEKAGISDRIIWYP